MSKLKRGGFFIPILRLSFVYRRALAETVAVGAIANTPNVKTISSVRPVPRHFPARRLF